MHLCWINSLFNVDTSEEINLMMIVYFALFHKELEKLQGYKQTTAK